MEQNSYPEYNKLPEKVMNVVRFANKQITEQGTANVNIENLCKIHGISKKTLYKYFKNKDEFIRACVLYHLFEVKTKINEIENLKDRPLEYIINFFKIIYEKIALIKVEFIYEVPFKYRAIWEEINTFRLGIIESLKPIIKKAQKQGLIKKNINVDFFLFLFSSIAQNVFTPEVFIEYDFSIKESLALLLEIMFNGILEDNVKVDIRKLLGER